MELRPVSMDAARVALERIGGWPFEDFFKQFFASVADDEFLPAGGVHDGGADAISGGGRIYESANRERHFYQASVRKDVKAKIRGTIAALTKAGRDPQRLTYVTSQSVSKLDLVEDSLSDELDCAIRIRDREYIASQVNSTRGTLAAYYNYLADVLERPIASRQTLPEQMAESSVYAFLRTELDQYEEGTSLVDAVTDSLLLWSLEGTDPDRELLRSPDDLRRLIYQALPWAREVIDARIETRLYMLASKPECTVRPVSWR